MALTLVLSVGLDAELLGLRTFILQSAGYFVVPAYSLKEAVDRFLSGDFDLVLLCQSIPTKEKERLTCLIRASGSRIPVVAIAGNLSQGTAFADATVESDPNAILMSIRALLLNAATPSICTPAALNKNDAGVAPRKEAPAARGQKSPQAANGYARQTKGSEEHCVPLAHAG